MSNEEVLRRAGKEENFRNNTGKEIIYLDKGGTTRKKFFWRRKAKNWTSLNFDKLIREQWAEMKEIWKEFLEQSR